MQDLIQICSDSQLTWGAPSFPTLTQGLILFPKSSAPYSADKKAGATRWECQSAVRQWKEGRRTYHTLPSLILLLFHFISERARDHITGASQAYTEE